ncbi:MAG: hypothetical protein E6G97_00260 [Alphaproteobacteria bacterium]|nr:MAG: hypothetical protein E6G97_00260 [Alphaproteobacteria bacterium]
MQLAQLLRRDLGRRAHQQILGALVHREQHDLARRPMVNWDVVGKNVDALTVMIKQGWAKLTG